MNDSCHYSDLYCLYNYYNPDSVKIVVGRSSETNHLYFVVFFAVLASLDKTSNVEHSVGLTTWVGFQGQSFYPGPDFCLSTIESVIAASPLPKQTTTNTDFLCKVKVNGA